MHSPGFAFFFFKSTNKANEIKTTFLFPGKAVPFSSNAPPLRSILCGVAPCEELPHYFHSSFLMSHKPRRKERERVQTADRPLSKASFGHLILFVKVHSLPLLVCEDSQLVLPLTLESVCFSTWTWTRHHEGESDSESTVYDHTERTAHTLVLCALSLFCLYPFSCLFYPFLSQPAGAAQQPLKP